mmetsp:Transcript_1916/g.4784  ORF Transcript_1916/g.4784 Transcript_1916/m.4784 type:complete len:108 (+) Transcript_1916:767-1090(+)
MPASAAGPILAERVPARKGVRRVLQSRLGRADDADHRLSARIENRRLKLPVHSQRLSSSRPLLLLPGHVLIDQSLNAGGCGVGDGTLGGRAVVLRAVALDHLVGHLL